VARKQEQRAAILAAIEKKVSERGVANLSEIAYEGSWYSREVAFVARQNGYVMKVQHGLGGVTAKHTNIFKEGTIPPEPTPWKTSKDNSPITLSGLRA
jgi:hypothetical protein